MTDLLPQDDADSTNDKKNARGAAGEYVVVARRYRPQTFADLIGQEHVVQGLIGAIQTNRIGHAFLFTGARGVGKTSAARILAKCLNCVKGPTTTPCNECEICQAISAGEDIDALEIDGASNRRIEEIRQLRQNVGVRPSRARFKIYIIDEVHMLTNEAFNALLKTLEEPPEHVKFIFCTTEADKIPITILSRCQRFDFAAIRPPEIVDRLRQIAEQEGVQVDPEALEILARRAAGSMRDSQSLLEQLLAFGKRKIAASDVHAMVGTATSARLHELVGHLVERNPAAALADLDAAVNEGVDVGQFLEQLLGYLRDFMAAAVGCGPDAFRYTSPHEAAAVVQWNEQWGLDTILAVMQILDQTLSRLRYSVHAQTLAEMAVVRICSLEDLESLATLVAQVRNGEPATPTAGPRSPAGSSVRPTTSVGQVASPAGEAKKKADLNDRASDAIPITRNDPPHRATPASASPQAVAPQAGGDETPPISADESAGQAPPLNGDEAPLATQQSPLTSESAPVIWQQVLANLSDILADYASFSTRQAIPAPNRLVVSFPAKYNSCKAFCERPDQLAKLQSALTTVTGQRVQVEFSLIEDEAGQAAREEPRRATSQRQLQQKYAQHPFVAKALEQFRSEIKNVEEAQA
jgi:DNA polymerase-3 subunit gamma/tau